MRIIAGSAGGLTLRAPKGHKTRPTADRVRESIFNILASRFALADVDVLDLFAGAGGLGIEALSRGARSAVFVDASPAALTSIRANLKTAKLLHRSRLIRARAPTGVRMLEERDRRFRGVFLDPPYGDGWVEKTLRRLARSPIVEPGTWLVVEHALGESGAAAYPPLVLTDRRRYGTTGVSFYECQDEGTA